MTYGEIKERIEELPSGCISYKTINGKRYAYHQWRENGKLKSKYLKASEVGYFLNLLEERKELEGILKEALLVETVPASLALRMQQKRISLYNRLFLGRPIAIGVQSYDTLMESGSFYVDKTRFLKEWWNNHDEVTLITRPRRFGKTLTLSMTECFFSTEYAGRQDLFADTDIWDDEEFRLLQGTFPVLRISFGSMKDSSIEELRESMRDMIVQLFLKYAPLLEDSALFSRELRDYYYERLRDLSTTNSSAVLASALPYLCGVLHAFYGRKVLLLIDEYDTPLQEAYIKGYYAKASDLMRSIFNACLKTNPHLFRALMTGITRVSKESMFSDLNHLHVCSMSEEDYADIFGFTEKELRLALTEQHISDPSLVNEIRSYYDGFTIGSHTALYNPWSISNYLRRRKFDTYWMNTSSNELAGKLFASGSLRMKQALEKLLCGESVSVSMEEDTAFLQLPQNEAAVWGLLYASGYVKRNGPDSQELILTNLEAHLVFERLVHGWFSSSVGNYDEFLTALLQNDLDAMNHYMKWVALSTFSIFDTAGFQTAEQEPERFYHGFVLGLLVDLRKDYELRSNRESGFGRYDIMLIPRIDGLPAYILEFKVFQASREKTLSDTVTRALKQIEEKRYVTELMERGIPEAQIHCYGFAFKGKEVLIG